LRACGEECGDGLLDAHELRLRLGRRLHRPARLPALPRPGAEPVGEHAVLVHPSHEPARRRRPLRAHEEQAHVPVAAREDHPPPGGAAAGAGGNDSTTKSARSASGASAAAAPGWSSASVAPSLPALVAYQKSPCSRPSGARQRGASARAGSPPGGSTLTTSTP